MKRISKQDFCRVYVTSNAVRYKIRPREGNSLDPCPNRLCTPTHHFLKYTMLSLFFPWMVETTSETMNTQATDNDATVVTFTSGLIICWTLPYSSALYKTPDCFLNSIPATRTDCYTRTFLQARVLGDGCGPATSSDPTVCLSSCSKHGPLYMIHSQQPYLHCKHTVSQNWARLWKEC